MQGHVLSILRGTADVLAVVLLTAMVSLAVHGAAEEKPEPLVTGRPASCWTDPMSDLAPLACGEFAGMAGVGGP